MTAPAHDGLIAGRYQLVAPIGIGGTATVYRGLDIQLPGTGIRWGGPGLLAENGCSTDPAVFGGVNGEHGGRLEAFCMDSNFGFSVFRTVQLSPRPGTPWSPWQSLKGSSDGAVTALQTPTITEILARTASGALAYETWTDQHGWSGWSMRPGAS